MLARAAALVAGAEVATPAPALTANTIMMLYSGRGPDMLAGLNAGGACQAQGGLAVQILKIVTTAVADSGLRYRVTISDGKHFMDSCLLPRGGRAEELVQSGAMGVFSIFSFTEYRLREVKVGLVPHRTTRFVLPLAIELEPSRWRERRIGSPINIIAIPLAKERRNTVLRSIGAGFQGQWMPPARDLESDGESLVTPDVDVQLDAFLPVQAKRADQLRAYEALHEMIFNPKGVRAAHPVPAFWRHCWYRTFPDLVAKGLRRYPRDANIQRLGFSMLNWFAEGPGPVATCAVGAGPDNLTFEERRSVQLLAWQHLPSYDEELGYSCVAASPCGDNVLCASREQLDRSVPSAELASEVLEALGNLARGNSELAYVAIATHRAQGWVKKAADLYADNEEVQRHALYALYWLACRNAAACELLAADPARAAHVVAARARDKYPASEYIRVYAAFIARRLAPIVLRTATAATGGAGSGSGPGGSKQLPEEAERIDGAGPVDGVPAASKVPGAEDAAAGKKQPASSSTQQKQKPQQKQQQKKRKKKKKR